jgi:hypothetical protein
LHKIKVAEILLVVANVDPTESRAKEAKFIVEKMEVSGMSRTVLQKSIVATSEAVVKCGGPASDAGFLQ